MESLFLRPEDGLIQGNRVFNIHRDVIPRLGIQMIFIDPMPNLLLEGQSTTMQVIYLVQLPPHFLVHPSLGYLLIVTSEIFPVFFQRAAFLEALQLRLFILRCSLQHQLKNRYIHIIGRSLAEGVCTIILLYRPHGSAAFTLPYLSRS